MSIIFALTGMGLPLWTRGLHAIEKLLQFSRVSIDCLLATLAFYQEQLLHLKTLSTKKGYQLQK